MVRVLHIGGFGVGLRMKSHIYSLPLNECAHIEKLMAYRIAN